MGAEPWSLPKLLFRMIPQFPSTPGARKCATPTAPGRHGHWRGLLAALQPDSYPAHTVPKPENHHPLEYNRSRRGVRPISARK